MTGSALPQENWDKILEYGSGIREAEQCSNEYQILLQYPHLLTCYADVKDAVAGGIVEAKLKDQFSAIHKNYRFLVEIIDKSLELWQQAKTWVGKPGTSFIDAAIVPETHALALRIEIGNRKAEGSRLLLNAAGTISRTSESCFEQSSDYIDTFSKFEKEMYCSKYESRLADMTSKIICSTYNHFDEFDEKQKYRIMNTTSQNLQSHCICDKLPQVENGSKENFWDILAAMVMESSIPAADRNAVNYRLDWLTEKVPDFGRALKQVGWHGKGREEPSLQRLQRATMPKTREPMLAADSRAADKQTLLASAPSKMPGLSEKSASKLPLTNHADEPSRVESSADDMKRLSLDDKVSDRDRKGSIFGR